MSFFSSDPKQELWDSASAKVRGEMERITGIPFWEWLASPLFAIADSQGKQIQVEHIAAEYKRITDEWESASKAYNKDAGYSDEIKQAAIDKMIALYSAAIDVRKLQEGTLDVADADGNLTGETVAPISLKEEVKEQTKKTVEAIEDTLVFGFKLGTVVMIAAAYFIWRASAGKG